MHASDQDVGVVGLSEGPQGLLGGLALVELLLHEGGIACLHVLPDLRLVLLLDVLRLVLEGKVVLLAVGDGADVELVLNGAEEALHGDGEGELGGIRAIHGHHVVVTSVHCVGFHHYLFLFSFLRL